MMWKRFVPQTETVALTGPIIQWSKVLRGTPDDRLKTLACFGTELAS